MDNSDAYQTMRMGGSILGLLKNLSAWITLCMRREPSKLAEKMWWNERNKQKKSKHAELFFPSSSSSLVSFSSSAFHFNSRRFFFFRILHSTSFLICALASVAARRDLHNASSLFLFFLNVAKSRSCPNSEAAKRFALKLWKRYFRTSKTVFRFSNESGIILL